MVRNEVSRLRSFGQLVEIQAARSPKLLTAIESALFACDQIRGELDHYTGLAHEFIQTLKRHESPVDPDGTILCNLEKARDSLGEAYRVFEAMRNSAKADTRLEDDDCVVDGFEGVLDACAAAQNALNDLCWALGEHDADFDDVLEGEFSSAEELIRALRG